mgnify:FL=1|tara:strand:+ start:411 stop:665 length:255 start_codon:yes stop_codon:yes gene_type:complete
MKYYVDSGELKVVLQAKSPLDACAKAIYKSLDAAKRIEDVPSFEQHFIVSEKGFATARDPFTLEVPLETVIDADDVLAYYGENY